MMRRIIVAVVGVVMAGALGWKLAEPSAVGGGFDATESLTFPRQEEEASVSVGDALTELYRRSVWSAKLPDSEGDTDAVAEEVPAPEGLERFRLLGILRVEGGEPEVLLQDLNAKDGSPSVFRVTEGDVLRDSGVILAHVGQQRISLGQSGEAKELFLFPQKPD